MIINLDRFIEDERPYWVELETFLDALDRRTGEGMSLAQAKRLHYLYQRTASDLSRIQTFAAEPAIRQYLETLVSRAYGEIHEVRGQAHRFNPLRWFFQTVPQTFRRRWRAFCCASLAMLVGSLFGAAALLIDRGSKDVTLPFGHLLGDPSERVAKEEAADGSELDDIKTMFASQLMTHNTKVSIFTMALGLSWGAGTIIMLFYNGVILGAVALDYIQSGEIVFLLGWLLPHGSVEIPSILIAGQAGLVLGFAMIGQGSSSTMRTRLRQAVPDIVTLILAVAILLIWAGIIEAFVSQYHAPVIPYAVKIAFGVLELGALFAFLTFGGRARKPEREEAHGH